MPNETTDCRKVYCGIDLFKLIAAVAVVLLHTVETTQWYPCEVKYVLTRFAVPFFFMVSGFFFCRGLSASENGKAYFLRYIKNIARLFLIWAIILYTPSEIVSYIRKYPDAGFLKIALYLFRRIFIIGPGPFWYLMALGWSAAFLYLCHVKGRDLCLKIAIAAGLLLEIGYSCFRGVLSSFFVFRLLFDAFYFVYSWEFNFIMFGIPFMGIGYLIARNGFTMKKRSAIALFLFSSAMRVLEYNLPLLLPSDFWDENSVSLFFIVQAFAFFMLGKEWMPRIGEKASKAVRQLSAFIYFFHAIFLYDILNPLLSKLTDWPIYDGSMILPKMIVVLAVCAALYALIRRIDNKYLNILING